MTIILLHKCFLGTAARLGRSMHKLLTTRGISLGNNMTTDVAVVNDKETRRNNNPLIFATPS